MSVATSFNASAIRVFEQLRATLRGNRVLRAASWTVGTHLTKQVIRLGSNLALTRLLVPESFGLMALAMSLLTGLHLFTDLGLKQSVVQDGNAEEQRYLGTVWTIQVGRGVLILGLTVLGSAVLALCQSQGLVRGTYAHPALPYVLGSLGLTAFVSGFDSVRLALASRNLALRQASVLEISTQVIGVFVTISCASLYRSVWAMVAGTLIATLARTILSHTYMPGRPDRLGWDRGVALRIVRFGSWVFLSSIAGFLLSNADRLVLAGLLPPDLFGQYAIAYLMASAAYWLISNVVVGVCFPALSSVVRNEGDVRGAYYRLRTPFEVASAFGFVILFFAAQPAIAFFYDGRYAGAGAFLKILALSLIPIPYLLADQLYLACGRAKTLFLVNVLRLFACYAAILAGYKLNGVNGAVLGVACSSLMAVPAILVFNRRLKVFSAPAEARTILVVLLTLGVVLAAGA